MTTPADESGRLSDTARALAMPPDSIVAQPSAPTEQTRQLMTAVYVSDREWPKGLASCAEVAAAVGLTEARLRELANAQLVPHWRIDGGDPLFNPTEVRRWLAKTALLSRCDGAQVPLTFIVTTDTQPVRASDAPDSLRLMARDLRSLPILGMVPGIYFLCLGADVVYVGQSVSPLARISQHRIEGKTFDRAYMLPCLLEHLDLLEGYCIKAIRPRLNGNTGPLTCEDTARNLYPCIATLSSADAPTAKALNATMPPVEGEARRHDLDA